MAFLQRWRAMNFLILLNNSLVINSYITIMIEVIIIYHQCHHFCRLQQQPAEKSHFVSKILCVSFPWWYPWSGSSPLACGSQRGIKSKINQKSFQTPQCQTSPVGAKSGRDTVVQSFVCFAAFQEVLKQHFAKVSLCCIARSDLLLWMKSLASALTPLNSGCAKLT